MGNSRLRASGTSASTAPALDDKTALYAVYGAVQGQPGLCHGRLHDGKGAHCAIGSFWDGAPKTTLHSSLIDEVAAVNDSVPHLSNVKRRAHVLRWLRWKLQQIGISTPGAKAKAI